MIHIDSVEVRAFADRLRDTTPHLRREMSKRVKAAASSFVRALQGNYSWSSRIPGAVRTRVGFGPRSSGVLVFVDAGAAPHARPLEFGNRGSGINRHPVFGNREAWTDQPTRPTFMRTIAANESQVVGQVEAAIRDVFNTLT
jgi:hypothetical protein